MLTLKEQMKMDMELKNYSPKTQDIYLRQMKGFTRYFNQSPVELGENHIKQYLHYLIVEKNVSKSYVNTVYSALKFFYETTLKRDWIGMRIPRTKKEKRLPVVLAKSEIIKLFNEVKNIKHRAILMTIYAAGLRVSEVANLKINDIDSERMQLRIYQGKGKKDRYVILSKLNLKILREYWKIYRPVHWLFPGEPSENAISSRTIQRVFEISKERAGITKHVTVHSLRHSFATHLLESGIDIYRIQQLMGHSSVKTTSVYIHVSQENSLSITSPLDTLNQEHISND